MELNQIGVIHSPYQEHKHAPRQGRLSDQEMVIEVFPEYADCLLSVENASHIFVLYWGDRANRQIHQSATPFCSDPVGVFASRSPNRPNPIAICVANLLRRDENKLIVSG